MQTEIFLSGITFEQLENSIKCIVKQEVDRIVSNQPLQPEPEPDYLTRKDVAAIYGVTLPTLHEWTKSGKVPAKRIGNRVRYLRSDVYAALKDVETLKYRRA